MAALTITELITAVTEHLGNRGSGKIGNSTISVAILASINKCIVQKIGKTRLALKNLQRQITIDVATGAYKYIIPVLDTTATTITIKDFLAMVVVKDAETTGYNMEKLSTQRRDTIFPYTSTEHVGRPVYYSVWGSYIELYPYPDADYTIYGRVSVWPAKVTTNSSSTGLGQEWDDAVEEYATADCFAKLQQTEDASLWFDAFAETYAHTIATLAYEPDWKPSSGMTDSAHVSEPWNDPFVRSL